MEYRIVFLLLGVFLSACTRIDVVPDNDGEYTDVILNVGYAVPVTRADAEAITDLWVLQYDGTGDDAELIGVPTYISEYSAGSSTVRLAVSGDRQNTIVFIANTNDPGLSFPLLSTLSDLKSRRFDGIDTQEEMVYSASGCYIGSIPYDMTSIGADEAVMLKRNYSRIHVILSNTTASGDAIDIQTVTLKNVPRATFLYTSYLNTASADASLTFPSLAGLSFTSIPIGWNDAPTVSGDAASREFSYSIPCNMRGINTESKTTLEKAKYAPQSATYLEVKATYTVDEETKPVVYSIYLGYNDINDYNICPNYEYDIHYVISGHGDDAVDSRVGDFSGVDFSVSERANCYIINPPLSGTQQYRIPVDRVNTFWGGNGYENDPSCCLSATSPWTVSIVWSDFEVDGVNFKFEKAEGVGFEDCFIVSVEAGVEGNVIIGCQNENSLTGRPNEMDEYIWSWHLWITAYNPSPSLEQSFKDGIRPDKFIYAVDKAGRNNVHRYKGAIWETGKYSDKFIMDRNLGEYTDKYHDFGTKGTLYYEYGRKDPLPSLYDIYLGGNEKTPNYVVNSKGVGSFAGVYSSSTTYKNHYPPAYPVSGAEILKTMEISVKNPGRWIIGSGYNDWTYQEKYNPNPFNGTIIWHDHLTAEGRRNEGRKSLFDPCPAGWRVPDKDTWDDFRMSTSTDATVNVSTYDDSPADRFGQDMTFANMHGVCYWPYVPNSDGSYKVTEYIYYPNAGYVSKVYVAGPVDILTRKHGNITDYMYSQSDKPASETDCYQVGFHIDYNSSTNLFMYTSKKSDTRWNCSSAAFTVRCVQD